MKTAAPPDPPRLSERVSWAPQRARSSRLGAPHRARLLARLPRVTHDVLLRPAGALAAIVLGALLHLDPAWRELGREVWLAGLVITGAPVVWRTIRGLVARRFAADLVAMLAIITAVALAQPLAGLVIVVMQTGGEALERFAERRASEAVRELEAAAPRIAHRLRPDGMEDVSVDEVEPGDRLLVRPGEMVPCDAVVTAGRSHVDVSRLTGEPVPVSAAAGVRLSSGSLNGESPLTIEAVARASESQYARIVELVRTAQSSKAPIQRLADRYAVWFTPLTLAACAVTFALTHDALRVLAVLVVATPCPLILAAPVAIIGGINRAARRQIVIRHGAALEQLGGVSVAVFDKTGTLTHGQVHVARVMPVGGFSEHDLLRLSGAVEQGSSHLLARALVEAAQTSATALPPASNVVEAAGQGVSGQVEGRHVAVGSRAYALLLHPALRDDIGRLDRALAPGGLRAYVSVDGSFAGTVEYADQVRAGLPEFFAHLRRSGIERTMLLSGDRPENVRPLAAAVGIRESASDLLPEDKARIVAELADAGETVLMVGDGTNDAPALSRAHVGIAMAAHGGGVSAEAADVVLLADDLGRVADAIDISRQTMRIARQSIWAGLVLSVTAMAFAALGGIPPTTGALLQEGIDVAVILNALRASR